MEKLLKKDLNNDLRQQIKNWKAHYPFKLVGPRLTVINDSEQFGMFANCVISKHSLLDVFRILPIDRRIISATDDDTISDYWFNYNKGFTCVALGNGSLFNHSEKPNAKHFFEKDLMFVYSVNDIKRDSEIFFNYGYNVGK